MTDLDAGMPSKQWMQLYSNVYNYCATSRPSQNARSAAKPAGGANFVGEVSGVGR